MEKSSHLGMAGHYAAMAEFLYCGYNVAVPAVDVGDDVYIVEDRGGTMWRLQVKTADDALKAERAPDGSLQSVTYSFGLSRDQLRTAKGNELFFMFVVRWQQRWRFLLIRTRPPIPVADVGARRWYWHRPWRERDDGSGQDEWSSGKGAGLQPRSSRRSSG